VVHRTPRELARDLAINEGERRVHEMEAGAEAPVVVLWPEDRPLYAVAVRLREETGEIRCDGFSVFPLAAGGTVGSAVLRSMPVGALISDAIRQELSMKRDEAKAELAHPAVEALDEEWGRNRDAFWRARANHYDDALKKARGKGTGRRYPPGHLERVAAIVREARARHDPASVAVAAVLNISKSAAANQISRARARGLLDMEEEVE
jgi:hypothetical protein